VKFGLPLLAAAAIALTGCSGASQNQAQDDSDRRVIYSCWGYDCGGSGKIDFDSMLIDPPPADPTCPNGGAFHEGRCVGVSHGIIIREAGEQKATW
jgi:hypothetical protein